MTEQFLLQPLLTLHRPPADHPFHFSQLNIIQDKIGFLLEVFAEGLQNQSLQNTTYECVHRRSPVISF